MDKMDFVTRRESVSASPAGQETTVSSSLVTRVVKTMDNARMELVSAPWGGMDDTALWV